jgi:hypothetical protein
VQVTFDGEVLGGRVGGRAPGDVLEGDGRVDGPIVRVEAGAGRAGVRVSRLLEHRRGGRESGQEAARCRGAARRGRGGLLDRPWLGYSAHEGAVPDAAAVPLGRLLDRDVLRRARAALPLLQPVGLHRAW